MKQYRVYYTLDNKRQCTTIEATTGKQAQEQVKHMYSEAKVGYAILIRK